MMQNGPQVYGNGYQTGGFNKPFVIESLSLLDSGSFNTPFYRPYTATLDAGNINSITNNVLSLSPDALGGRIPFTALSDQSSIIMPTAAPEGMIKIDNGWETNRLRFTLIIIVTQMSGVRQRYMMQGYTDHKGFSVVNGRPVPDPNMIFTISNFVKIGEQRTQSDYGQVMNPMILNKSLLLSNNQWGDGLSYNDPSSRIYTEDATSLLGTMQLTHLANLSMGSGISEYDDVSRIQGDSRALLTHLPRTVDLSELVPSTFLSKLISTMLISTASDGSNFDGDTFSRAKGLLTSNNSTTLYGNPWFKYMTSIESTTLGVFRFSDLLQMDSGIIDKTTYFKPNEKTDGYINPSSQNTNYWTGSDLETQMATVLMNTVPVLMTQCKLGTVSFSATNMTMDSSVIITFERALPIIPSELSNVNDIEEFKKLFILQIHPLLSYSGIYYYSINITAQINGNLKITISMNGGSPILYNAPIYAINLTSSFLTQNPERIVHTSNQLDGLLSSITNEVHYNKHSHASMGAAFF